MCSLCLGEVQHRQAEPSWGPASPFLHPASPTAKERISAQGSRCRALLTQSLLPPGHTPLVEAVRKRPTAKQRCGESGFRIYWG